MVFSVPVFLFLFLPVLLVLYYLPCFRGRRARNAILLAFSLFFYAWGEPLFVFVMCLSVLANWAIVLRMERSARKKAWLALAILIDVGLLFFCKYVPALASALLPKGNLRTLLRSIPLPIGISFFTFQLMSYAFDVYRGDARAQKSFPRVLLYVSLFPQLVAGPIVRYAQIEEAMDDRQESLQDVAEGMRRFVYGLAKKALLADFLARLVDAVFAVLSPRPAATAWLAAIAYTLQIYFDFSGYSDMAIGLGRMFGFRFSENFLFPYTASSGTVFWRRWHISLSTWFRDYVYIPLGGSRTGRARWVRNMLVVWLLTGVWHGASLTFVAWGLIWFAVLVSERLLHLEDRNTVLSHALTLLVVVCSFVMFRAPRVFVGLRFLMDMFGLRGAGFANSSTAVALRSALPLLLAGCLAATPLPMRLGEFLHSRRLGWLEGLWLVAVFAVSVAEALTSTYQPFIYFNF